MSFPSGHVILIGGITGLLALSLEWQYAWIPWTLTALVMLGRVYVGAHNPLDVTAGLGAGLIIGAGLLFVVAWL